MLPFKPTKTSSENQEWSMEKLLNKCQKYCSAAEHCTQEVKTLLDKYTSDATLINTVIERLYEEGYVSDERYCRAYIHDKICYQHWGRLKIRQGLLIKKIPESTIDNALKIIDLDEYYDILQKLVNKKRSVNPIQLKRFLYQRGFSFEDMEHIDFQ